MRCYDLLLDGESLNALSVIEGKLVRYRGMVWLIKLVPVDSVRSILRKERVE